MAKTNEKSNAAPQEPWRGGRPSFKAFYPELILLVFFTIAWLALGVTLGCRNKDKSIGEPPKQVESWAPAFTSQAFAADASLDDDATTAPTATDAQTDVAASTAPVATDAQTDAAASTAPVATDAQTDAAASTAPTATDAQADAAGKKNIGKYIFWGFWLLVPVCVWIWRASKWFVAVYGIKFEIRTDVDNPKATSILVHRGILNRKTDTLHIAQIKDMQTSQSLVQKYFQGGVGTIRLFTNDLTDGILVMKNMEEPSRVFNALDELKRKYWSIGGLGGGLGGGAAADVDAIDGMDGLAG